MRGEVRDLVVCSAGILLRKCLQLDATVEAFQELSYFQITFLRWFYRGNSLMVEIVIILSIFKF